MRSGVLVLVAAMAVVGTSACGRSERLGAGEDVGFCIGWQEWEALEEPQPTDKDESLRWAEGGLRIVDRIDLRVDIDDEEPPPVVGRSLKTVEAELEEYRDALKDADGDDVDALRRAAARLGAGTFDKAVDDLTKVSVGVCTAEDRR